MRKVVVTGMSGTGKSTALAELEQRGFAVVDTDEGSWTGTRTTNDHTRSTRASRSTTWSSSWSQSVTPEGVRRRL